MMLPILVDEYEAAAIAGAPAGSGVLYAYPLLGAVFSVTGARGPARRLLGCLAHAIVDKQTGRAQTSDPWTLVPVPEHAVLQEVSSLPRRQLLSDAYAVVSLRLRKTWKLASRIELEVAEVIDPLYKPNWLFEAGGRRVLVDGVTGRFAATSP